jgi:hypothetical protein
MSFAARALTRDSEPVVPVPVDGVETTDQLAPSQCSTSGWDVPPGLAKPTAQTLVAETAATPSNEDTL